jgi:hypothetical protein
MKETNGEFMKVLLAEEEDGGGGGGGGGKVLNRRGIVYFATKPANNGRSGIDEEGNFYDPWGQMYRVYMDGDYNSKITIDDVGEDNDKMSQTDMRVEIGVASAGRPKGSGDVGLNKFDDGNELTTW